LVDSLNVIQLVSVFTFTVGRNIRCKNERHVLIKGLAISGHLLVRLSAGLRCIC